MAEPVAPVLPEEPMTSVVLAESGEPDNEGPAGHLGPGGLNWSHIKIEFLRNIKGDKKAHLICNYDWIIIFPGLSQMLIFS